MRPGPIESTASDALTYGAVHLNVTDLDRSLVFWRDLIGMTELGRDTRQERSAGAAGSPGAVRLGVKDESGTGEAELIVLHPGATQPVQRGYSALYHLAIHMPSEAEFARLLARLFAARYPNAPTDHVTHWATYLDDPDGINVEIAFETIDRVGKIDIVGGRPLIIDSEGRRHDMTEPLGLEEVFSHREDDDVTSSLPAGTRIGHVHLYVGDLEAAQAFYEEMGFTRHMDAAGIGFADLSLGGTFPHRIAVNVWQGIGAPQAPAGTAGMKHFELFESEPSGETRELEDPSGNRLLICPRP
ncbi:MAG: VOC family protein [Solirubrobacterales bacterium]|nr:VOC family protein [Solirubrobacterales bacterium]